MDINLQADATCGNGGIDEVRVALERPSPALLTLRYTVLGDIDRIALPPPGPPLRTDGLWESTCFEAFLRAEGGDSYLELNFAPSGRWAAYAFSSYRSGMAPAPMPTPPEIATRRQPGRLDVDVAVSPLLGPAPYSVNLAAILAGPGGERSFWAASHPGGEPDFHHPGCFIHRLPAARPA